MEPQSAIENTQGRKEAPKPPVEDTVQCRFLYLAETQVLYDSKSRLDKDNASHCKVAYHRMVAHMILEIDGHIDPDNGSGKSQCDCEHLEGRMDPGNGPARRKEVQGKAEIRE